VVGVDVGLRSFPALSDDELIDNRRMGRRKKHGVGRRKAAKQAVFPQEHTAIQRREFWHKTTARLAQIYRLIAVEQLRLAFMTWKDNLTLSASDAALGLLRQLFDDQVESTGGRVVDVNPNNITQTCSGRASNVPKSLNIRTHSCPHCGISLDRHLNAALNILSRRLRVEALP